MSHFLFSTAGKAQAPWTHGLWNRHWRTWKDLSEWPSSRSPVLPQWRLFSKCPLFKPSKFRRDPQGDPPKGAMFPCRFGELSALPVATLQHSHCSESPHLALESAQRSCKVGRVRAQWHSGCWDGSGTGCRLDPAGTASRPVSERVQLLSFLASQGTSSLRPFLTENFQATETNQWQR